MRSDAITACADMTLVDAIQDLALSTGASQDAIRDSIIDSGAYEALYDELTGLWGGGPDAFVDFYRNMVRRRGAEA